jgi:cytochrome o ubiquinol oxidase subunit 2
MLRTARCTAWLAPFALGGCHAAVLDPQGQVGLAERTILLDSFGIMLAIVLPTIAATAGFGWWFRASNTRARRLPDWAYSGQLELLVWAVPLLTILLLGGVAWVASHDLDPAQPLASRQRPLDVQVVSLDWKWLFIYPEQRVASVNRLVIPVGVPVHFSLTSASVMNAFFIPRLGSMIYTMNGMETQLYLSADSPGTYHGLSSHFSGDGFADMHFDVQAVAADQFASWVATARAGGPTLTPKLYLALAAQGKRVATGMFRDVDPGLFQKIVMQTLPPGPGPAPAVSPRAPVGESD